MPHPFFDTGRYPWHREDARAVHRVLYSAVQKFDAIKFLYMACSADLLPLKEQAADLVWEEALGKLAAAASLRQLCDLVLQRRDLASCHPAIRALIEAKDLVDPLEKRLTSSEKLVVPSRTAPDLEPMTANASILRILFLAADPFAGLRLDQELREIHDKLRQARLRERFELRSVPAVRPEDFVGALHEFQPNIVHFSGHGLEEGVLLMHGPEGQEHPVMPHALASLFALVADRVQCVVLNACYSRRQAQAISRRIPYVIGIRREVDDRAAITFSIGFYQALGDGSPIEEAFSRGRVLVHMYNFKDFRSLILWKNGKVMRDQEC